MSRRAGRLADGREIFYFQEAGSATGFAPDDARDLPPYAPASSMRHDVLLDEWVALAGHRQDRTHLPPDEQCPLCPSRNGRRTEIPAPSYDVVVFENRFPSFSLAVAPSEPVAGSALFDERPGVGRCEVVCFTEDHHSSFSQLSVRRVRTVIEAWIDRTLALSAMPRVKQVFCFENRGEEIGVTLSHPHGQIYGYPFVTPRTRRMLTSATDYRQRTGRNLFRDVLQAEQAAGERVIARGSHWTAFVPFAARWPFEVHLYPNRQVPDLPSLDSAEQDDLAQMYLDLLSRFDAVYGEPLPYIAAWHQAPTSEGRELSYLHLQLFSIRRAPGKLKHLAGSESAMGAFINDIPPETAARMLREAAS